MREMMELALAWIEPEAQDAYVRAVYRLLEDDVRHGRKLIGRR